MTWPLVVLRRPWVIAHQTWISRTDGSLAWQDRFKRLTLRYAENISISRAIAANLPVPSTIIGNPYDNRSFRLIEGIPRNRELVFLGRLVSDKGCDLLLLALIELKNFGITPQLTIIGTGPEEPSLRALVTKSKLAAQVNFVGRKSGEELAELLNGHRIMVVPSRWAEPFGVVALEGIACGCVVVGSEEGGLTDAIGPCGVTFPNGDLTSLSNVLRNLLGDKVLMTSIHADASSHLAKHTAPTVAAAYLGFFERLAQS